MHWGVHWRHPITLRLYAMRGVFVVRRTLGQQFSKPALRAAQVVILVPLFFFCYCMYEWETDEANQVGHFHNPSLLLCMLLHYLVRQCRT